MTAKRISKEDFIDVYADTIHYDYKHLPDDVPLDDKVRIVCLLHGEFGQRLRDHIRCVTEHRAACAFCLVSKKYTTPSFVDAAKRVHGAKYDYSQTQYKNTKTKVIVVCNKRSVPPPWVYDRRNKITRESERHGAFHVYPNNHIDEKEGCPICEGHYAVKLIGYSDQCMS